MRTLKRIISALRVWLGWGDPSEDRMSPAQGWLLPALSTLRAVRTHAEGPRPDALDGRSTPRG